MSPRVWCLLGDRPGDNSQVLALAEELGLPFETRTLSYNFFHLLTGKRMWPSLLAVDRASKTTLAPPWPDLIIAVGRRSVPVARWIRKANGGRTKLVLIGHPRVSPRHLDLVFTTRQYLTPEGASMRLMPVAMSRFREPPLPSEEERAWLEALPRPHLLMMLGGKTKYWMMRPGPIAQIAAGLAARAEAQGGSLIVVGSHRTSPSLLDAIEALGSASIHVLRNNLPRFAVLMAEADELYPTADSVSMISESIITGKPVGIVPVELGKDGERALGGHLLARNPRRDLRRLWNYLFEQGMAGTTDAPVASTTPNPVTDAAAQVRELIGIPPKRA